MTQPPPDRKEGGCPKAKYGVRGQTPLIRHSATFSPHFVQGEENDVALLPAAFGGEKVPEGRMRGGGATRSNLKAIAPPQGGDVPCA